MKSVINTPMGKIDVTTLGHASVLLEINGKKIYMDPYSEVADFSPMPAADMVIITHDHYDHYDPEALKHILTSDTIVVSNADVAKQMPITHTMANGDEIEIDGIKIKAVPAYNIEHRNEDGQHFHPSGVGNGYILSFGGYTLYFAGDTENIPQMKDLCGEIDVAFLPKNLPYTMSDEMWIDAVQMIRPRVAVYPYHYFELDKEALQAALPGVEIRE